MENWQEALKTKLGQRVRWDPVTLQIYSTAACIYEITPLAVVVPESTEDVINTVNICHQFNVPVLPRGGGSGLTGSSVGKAVILDLTNHFKKIELLSNDRARVNVGVILNDLQAELNKSGLIFAPDPSSGNVCVIGGMLGNNCGGPHTLQNGNMYRHVDEISVILANGKEFQAKNIKIEDISSLDEFHRPYYEKVHQVLDQYKDKIEKNRPAVTKNAAGYQVWDILTSDHLNMASLFVGSEGTLGVFIDAILKIITRKPKRGIISFYFSALPNMGKAVQVLRKMDASALEFVDETFIKMALSFKPELKQFLPEKVHYLLYVEFESDSEKSILQSLKKAENEIVHNQKLGEKGSSSTDESEIEQIFKLRKLGVGVLNKIPGKKKPISFIEDSAIHPDKFPDFLQEVGQLFNEHDQEYVVLGHAGDGNLHIRPLINLKDKNIVPHIENLMEKFVDLVNRFGGTLTGEHGDGRLRTPFLAKQFPDLMPLFEEIKNLFDPQGIMNPGIIISGTKYKWSNDFRYNPDYQYVEIGSRLDEEKWRMEIEKCHGCGTCREYCPVFVATGEEEATARAKANILRGLISGKMSQDTIDTDHFFKIMDYCLNCGQCLTDCPTAVDIPGMAVLAKEKLHEKRPYKINELMLQNGQSVSKIAAATAPISNAALKFRGTRYVMDKISGIDKRRDFPVFKRSYIHKNPLSTSKMEDRKMVVLWTGCAAQYNDPYGEHHKSIGLLEALGYEVIVPKWKCCNIAKITYGNFSSIQNDLDYNKEILQPYAEEQVPILFSSASCGYAFKDEYVNYFPQDKEINKIAGTSYDIHDFLMRTYLNGEFKRDFSPIPMQIIYHEPCHLKSQQNEYGPTDLLKLIPELELIDVEDSCCGIAGTYGMKKENYDLSMEIGKPLFVKIQEAKPELLVSGCGTCQIQLLKGTGIKTVHPITLLFQSYMKKDP